MIGSRIKAARKERNLTQAALADLLGVHVQMVKDYERDAKTPRTERLYHIAETLGVTADWLLQDTQALPPPRPEPQEQQPAWVQVLIDAFGAQAEESRRNAAAAMVVAERTEKQLRRISRQNRALRAEIRALEKKIATSGATAIPSQAVASEPLRPASSG